MLNNNNRKYSPQVGDRIKITNIFTIGRITSESVYFFSLGSPTVLQETRFLIDYVVKQVENGSWQLVGGRLDGIPTCCDRYRGLFKLCQRCGKTL